LNEKAATFCNHDLIDAANDPAKAERYTDLFGTAAQLKPTELIFH
jgi:hypothetical protein